MVVSITPIRGASKISGNRFVAFEFLNGKCYNAECQGHRLFMLTGFVLPPGGAENWGKADWRKDSWKLGSFFPLELFADDLGHQAAAHLDALRVKANEIAIVDKRHSRTTNADYWANICPACRRMQGANFLLREREALTASRTARRDNKLIYRGVWVNIVGEATSVEEVHRRGYIDHLFRG